MWNSDYHSLRSLNIDVVLLQLQRYFTNCHSVLKWLTLLPNVSQCSTFTLLMFPVANVLGIRKFVRENTGMTDIGIAREEFRRDPSFKY